MIGQTIGEMVAGGVAGRNGNGAAIAKKLAMNASQAGSNTAPMPPGIKELAQLQFEALTEDAATAAGLPAGTAIATRGDGTRIYSLPSQSGRIRGGDFTAWTFDGEGRVIIAATTDFHVAAAISDTESLMFFTNSAGQSSETISAWARPGEIRAIDVPEIGGGVWFVGPARGEPLTQFAAGGIRAFVGGGHDLGQMGLSAIKNPVRAAQGIIDWNVSTYRAAYNTGVMLTTDSGRAQIGGQISNWANRTGSNIAWHANNGSLWDGAGQIAGNIALGEVTGGGLLRAGPTRAPAIVRELEAAPGHTRAYRAVSDAEFADAMSTGRFNVGPNSLEGKWFADTIDGVISHGDGLHGAGRYRIIQADLPDAAPSLYRLPNLDGYGPARYLGIDDLAGVRPRPLSGGN